MLWLTKDTDGLCLFTGNRPPEWENGRSSSNEDDDSFFLEYIKPDDIAGTPLNAGECIPVILTERKGK